MPELVFISLFVVIFGIFFLHYSTRNKERLSLIEKGADASIFFSAKPQNKKTIPVWKILIINLAMVLFGIGLGFIVAFTLTNNLEFHDRAPIQVGTVFIITGLSLLGGFFITNKMIDKENK